MTLIKVISFIIFVISCVAIYHNTNSYEPKKRILYIVVGMLVMYGITSIICSIDIKGVEVQNVQALEDTLNVMKWIFTPINALVALTSLGNTFGKVKDQEITTEKAQKRLIIIAVVLILLFAFETGYIKDFITGVLG